MVKRNGHLKDVILKMVPLNGTGRAEGLHFIVLFEDAAPAAVPAVSGPGDARQAKGGRAKSGDTRTVRDNARLKQEMAATREYLQSIIEDQEAATEGLKSAKKRPNEERETAKEELQSSNEELNRANDELKAKQRRLGRKRPEHPAFHAIDGTHAQSDRARQSRRG